jgi:hypothetical protein
MHGQKNVKFVRYVYIHWCKQPNKWKSLFDKLSLKPMMFEKCGRRQKLKN